MNNMNMWLLVEGSKSKIICASKSSPRNVSLCPTVTPGEGRRPGVCQGDQKEVMVEPSLGGSISCAPDDPYSSEDCRKVQLEISQLLQTATWVEGPATVRWKAGYKGGLSQQGRTVSTRWRNQLNLTNLGALRRRCGEPRAGPFWDLSPLLVQPSITLEETTDVWSKEDQYAHKER